MDLAARTREVFILGNHFLATQMSAALVLDLVFDVEARNTSGDVLLHGLGDHQGTCPVCQTPFTFVGV